MSRTRESLPTPAIGRPQQQPSAPHREPLLGSYFVSAYPPFGYWTEAEVGSFERCLGEPSTTGDGFGLYLHIPFCAERCQYCYYLSHDILIEQFYC